MSMNGSKRKMKSNDCTQSFLQDEKHQLFLTLKKVLNEDETRRRKETDEMNIMYGAHSNSVLPIAGQIYTRFFLQILKTVFPFTLF
jgi:G-protein pathway suppressor